MKWPLLRLTEPRRKFAREVGSVVLGVLIALGLGEVADAARWQVRAARSNSAINGELARAAGVLDERVLVQACMDRRLAELDRLVRAARSSNSLPDIGEIGRPPSRPIATAAWDDAVGSGALLRFDNERREELSLNYPLIREYPERMNEEQILWATLRIIEGVPGPASSDLLTEAAVSISRLRFVSLLNGINAQQTRDAILASGVPPSYFLVVDREGSGRAAVIAALRSRAICQPLAVRDAT